MRRLIDSLILVLVAYTLIVPLVRSLTPETEPNGPACNWCVVGENVAGAELRLRLESSDGRAQHFEVVCDEQGCFQLPLARAPEPAATLAVFDGEGVTLTQVQVDAVAEREVVDLGPLRAAQTPR